MAAASKHGQDNDEKNDSSRFTTQISCQLEGRSKTQVLGVEPNWRLRPNNPMPPVPDSIGACGSVALGDIISAVFDSEQKWNNPPKVPRHIWS